MTPRLASWRCGGCRFRPWGAPSGPSRRECARCPIELAKASSRASVPTYPTRAVWICSPGLGRSGSRRSRAERHPAPSSMRRAPRPPPSDPTSNGLVFLDPPYELADPSLSGFLAALDAGWLAPEGWTVVLTRGHKSSLPTVPVHWATRRQLRYGDSLLTLYRED